ncbi:MAG TPA: hypothetical protein VGH13_04545 [Xanthobacteraceae bacterium]|jgi:hypothetical protein
MSIKQWANWSVLDLSNIVSIFGVIAGIVGFIITLVPNDRQAKIDPVNAAVAKIEKRFSELNEQVDKVDSALGRLEKLPTDADSRAIVATFNDRISSAENRLKTIEDLVVQDPQKSLSIVLIKRDLENLQKSLDEKTAAENAGIERLYNMFGWSIGALIFAVAAQLIAGVLSRQKAS